MYSCGRDSLMMEYVSCDHHFSYVLEKVRVKVRDYFQWLSDIFSWETKIWIKAVLRSNSSYSVHSMNGCVADAAAGRISRDTICGVSTYGCQVVS